MPQIIPLDLLTGNASCRDIASHRPIAPSFFSIRPGALQPINFSPDTYTFIQLPGPKHKRIELALREERHGGGFGPVVQEHLQDRPIDDAQEPERPRVRVDEAVGAELVRQEGVVVPADGAAIDPERGVAAEEEAAAEGFAGDGRQEGEVCGPCCVDGGDACYVEGEGEGARGHGGAVVMDERGVDQAGGVGYGGRGCVDGLQAVRVGEQRVAHPGRVGKNIPSGQAHH